MSKRKVQFAEDEECVEPEGEDADLEHAFEAGAGNSQIQKDVNKATRFKEKHSLDSDEEDNTDKYDMMQEDDIEGQEDTKVDIEDGITFTPFNMREELEEGHFDAEGTYIFKRDKTLIKDSWMDNIDWVKVKERPGDLPKDADSDDESDDPIHSVDEIGSYKEMLELMNPGESVIKALKRLGGGKAGAASSSASQKWKTKKKHKTEESTTSAEDLAANKEKLLKLTGLSDALLASGNMEIYQDTYEKLSFKVKLAEDKEKATKPNIPEDADDDDALDMFADSIDQKSSNTETNTSGEGRHSETEPSSSKGDEKTDEADTSKTELRWEYKWENKEEAEVHGPFTSSEMFKWSEDGFFADGVFVRKRNAEGQFYSSRRIDFELYT